MKKWVMGIIMVALLAGGAGATDVPPEIIRQIKDSVAARHPDNYSIQKVLVDGNIEDYKWIQELTHVDKVPDAILVKIKASIQKRHPGNYSIQKTLIEGQINDYISLNR